MLSSHNLSPDQCEVGTIQHTETYWNCRAPTTQHPSPAFSNCIVMARSISGSHRVVAMQPVTGSIALILGPMFSGKTSELLKRVRPTNRDRAAYNHCTQFSFCRYIDAAKPAPTLPSPSAHPLPPSAPRRAMHMFRHLTSTVCNIHVQIQGCEAGKAACGPEGAVPCAEIQEGHAILAGRRGKHA